MANEGSHNLISVENFNPEQGHEINSPRSLEAMRILGIVHDQIAEYPSQQYLDEWPEAECQAKLIEHHQEKRKEFIRDISEKRDEIIKNGGDAFGVMLNKKNQTSKIASSYQNDTSTMIDKERKALELMKKKQQQDIEQMLDYEMKMQ